MGCAWCSKQPDGSPAAPQKKGAGAGLGLEAFDKLIEFFDANGVGQPRYEAYRQCSPPPTALLTFYKPTLLDFKLHMGLFSAPGPVYFTLTRMINAK